MGHANLRLVREVAARIPDPKTRSQILGEVAGILGRAGAPQEFEQAFAEALQALREAVTSKFSRALTRSRHGPAEPSGDLAPSPAEDRDEADDLADEDADMESEEPAPDLDPLQLLPTVTRERLKAVEEAARSGDARHLQEALDLALVPVLERDAHERAAALGTLAGVLLRLGRPQEAERLFDEALRAYRDIRGIPGPWGIYGHTQLQRQRQVIAVWRQALRELLHEGEAERILRWVIRGSDPDFNPLLKECAYPLARAGKLHLLLEHLPDLDTFRDTIAALARSGHLPEISLAVNALCTRPHVLSGTPLNNLLPRLAQLTSILAELGLHEEAERLSQLGQRRLLAAARAFLSEHASSRQPPSLPEFALLEEDPPPPHKQEEMEQHEAQEPEMWFQKAERAVEVLEEAFDLTEWLCASGLSGVAAAILDAVEDFLLFLEEEMVEEDLGDSAELLVRAVANLAAAGRVRDAVRLLDHLFQTAEHVWEDYLKYAIAADPDGGFHSFLEVLQKRCSDVVRAFLDAGAQEEARRFFHAVSAACEFGPAEERKALEPVLQQLMEKGDLEAARQVLWLARPSVRRQLLSTIAGFASSGTAEWAIPFVQAAMRAAVRAVFGPDKILLPRSPLDVEEEPWERPTGRKRSSVWLPADLRSHIRGIASGSGSDLWVEEAALAATACWSDEALAGCVEGLGSLGRFGEALVLSSGISDVPTRFRVLNGLLSRMEQEGYLSEVEQHAESEFDPETRAVLLAAIGDRLRATGQTEEARARFREALEAAETAGRSAVLAQVVRAAAELLPDASERCLSSVRGIPRPEARCQRLLDLAVPSAQLGLWDIVREAIEVGVDVYDEGWPDWGELGRKLGAAVACTGSADGIIQLLKTVAGCLRFVDSPEIGAHELVVG
ncbi:MAG: tetratricopeptide repeat protein, partial [Armatimonadota bacterium]|nr:tetratricopeptide repeat protein [Armatimonadota bacterium]